MRAVAFPRGLFQGRVWTGFVEKRGLLLLAGLTVAAALATDVLSWSSALLAVCALAAGAFVERTRSARFDPSGAGGAGGGAQDAAPLPAPLLDAMPDPAVLLDARGVVRMHNAAATPAFGKIRLGDPISFAIRVPEVLDAIRAAAAGAPARAVEYADRVPFDRWIEAHVAPVWSASAESASGTPPDYVLLVLHDLTHLRRAERMRVDFVANASHELRTPLASLLGFIETLQGPARNDAVARGRFLEIMREQANRMARLVDDLLSLSRIEQKQHLRPDTPVDLVLLVRNVLDALTPLARDRGVALRAEMPEEPVTVPGDRDELIRVIENLVENGIKYGQAGGHLDVRVERRAGSGDRDEARVSVRDHGPGIAPEHLPRLTERFYRVDVGESRDKGGTGLGLAIVKHILARHRGRLVIESEPGQGATFTAVLDGLRGASEAERVRRSLDRVVI